MNPINFFSKLAIFSRVIPLDATYKGVTSYALTWLKGLALAQPST
jgi:hypothetical protein